MPLAKRASTFVPAPGVPAWGVPASGVPAPGVPVPGRRLLAGFLLLAGLLGLADEAGADAYTVSGIEVDVEAADAVTAREQAIEEAQMKGLRQLLERLTLPEYANRLPAVGQQSLTRLVSAFEVEEESLSATRYVGRLGVSYDEEAVQNLLEGTGVPIVLDQPPSLLVVPALDADGTLELFTGPGGWRDAWAAEARSNTLLDIALPLGDLGDLRALSSQALASEPETALQIAAQRYGQDAAVLLVARPDDARNPTRVNVSLAGGYAWPTGFSGESLAMDADAETVWRAAARRALRTLETEWKRENLVAMDQLARLAVEVPLDTFDDWTDIRQRLGAVAAIRRIDVETFSQSEVQLIFNHIGNVEQLRRALETRGLSLTQGADAWLLRRTAGQRAG